MKMATSFTCLMKMLVRFTSHAIIVLGAVYLVYRNDTDIELLQASRYLYYEWVGDVIFPMWIICVVFFAIGNVAVEVLKEIEKEEKDDSSDL